MRKQNDILSSYTNKLHPFRKYGKNKIPVLKHLYIMNRSSFNDNLELYLQSFVNVYLIFPPFVLIKVYKTFLRIILQNGS